jgi:hypothetical protein
MGSHSEKEYLEKTVQFMDGLIIGANLVEATPGATASLLVKFGGKKLSCPFYLDPMTYTFGNYVDQSSGAIRNDLDWIKSEQQSRVTKKVTRDYKRSYKKLGESLGGPFLAALNRGKAVSDADFAVEADRRAICREVSDYQLNRIRKEFEGDPEYEQFADRIPTPAAVFPPYFYIEPHDWKRWFDLALSLAASTAGLGLGVPVHAVICADAEFLENKDFLNALSVELPKVGVAGVWLWFSRFNEHDAAEVRLKNFRGLVRLLSNAGLEVFNMHGGFFSLALAPDGMSAVSHGVGYGEQKDVMPVIGQSTPTVRYYLPKTHIKVGVPQVEYCLPFLKVATPVDFHQEVCDCVICKGIVKASLDEFRSFGEMHFSTPDSKKQAQTPAAAKRCRFHFLLSRIKERDWLRGSTRATVLGQLENGYGQWGKFPPIAASCAHLPRWIAALS